MAQYNIVELIWTEGIIVNHGATNIIVTVKDAKKNEVKICVVIRLVFTYNL